MKTQQVREDCFNLDKSSRVLPSAVKECAIACNFSAEMKMAAQAPSMPLTSPRCIAVFLLFLLMYVAASSSLVQAQKYNLTIGAFVPIRNWDATTIMSCVPLAVDRINADPDLLPDVRCAH